MMCAKLISHPQADPGPIRMEEHIGNRGGTKRSFELAMTASYSKYCIMVGLMESNSNVLCINLSQLARMGLGITGQGLGDSG
jgi:hypothetical protein